MISIFRKRHAQVGLLLFILAAVGMVVGLMTSWTAFAMILMACLAICGLLLLWIIRTVHTTTTGTRQSLQKSTHASIAINKKLHDETINQIAALRVNLEKVVATGSKEQTRHSFGNGFRQSGQFFGIGPDYEYAQRIQNDVSGFETFALRSQSLRIRDAFALNATRMQFDYTTLMRVLHAERAGYTKGVFSRISSSWNRESLLALGRVVANQRTLVTDTHDCVCIFWSVEKVWGAEALGKTAHYLYIEALQDLNLSKQTNLKLKEFRLTVRNPVQTRLVKANLVHGVIKDDLASTWSRWAEEVNRPYLNENFAPIGIGSGPSSAIDRILVQEAVPTALGPKVSVIMPTYNGGSYVLTAVNSLMDQSWRNLELIIVDDRSDDEHFAILSDIAAKDNRIILMRQKYNSGAYAARNTGLAASSGEFITVHDDDDWSHPQKLEMQMRHLLNNEHLFANMSRHARVTPDLRFVRINNNPSFAQPNFSSMLIRRELFDEIGQWDTVNRSGDSEFRDRIHAFTQTSVEVVGEAPMSFTRTRPDSLTAGEMSRGYVDPARRFYMESYLSWHNKVVDKEDVSKNIQSRPFAIPLNMESSMRGKHFGTYDVVYATDFRFPGGTTSLTVREILAAHRSGLRVGIVQLDSPMNKPSTPMSPLISEIIANSTAELLSLKDRADARLLIVRHPTVVQFADTTESNLVIRRLLMIVNNTPILRGGKGCAFDIAECSAILERIFSVSCEVVPESGVTRRMCEELVGKELLADFDWLGFVGEGASASSPDYNGMPIVGRHSRDHLVKWPNKERDLFDAYVQPKSFLTRILGGADSISTIFDPTVLKSVEVLPFGAMSPTEFLQGIDFWVYFHSDSYAESFGMAPAEAMAAGLVVILPPYMKSTFGEGAIYCQPAEVAVTVKRYWENPEAYNRQVDLGLKFIEANLSEKAYVARLIETIPNIQSVVV